MTSHLIAPTTLVALLVGAAPASAGAPWSAPQELTDAPARTPALAFTTHGVGIATLGVGVVSTHVAALRVGSAVPADPGRNVTSVLDGPLPYAQEASLSLRARGPANGPATVGWSAGTPGTGAVGKFRPLATVTLRPGEAELAVSPNGSAVLAFAQERGGSSRVWLSTRRPGGAFGSPRVVRGSGSARSLAVSVNDRGRFVLAYALGGNDRRIVEARIGTVADGPGALQEIGRQLGRAEVDAVVAPSGRTSVAWTTYDLGEEQNDPTQLHTNVAPAGRSTFAGQVVLDRAPPGALFDRSTGPKLAAAPDGTTLVAYTLSGRFVGDEAVTPARVSVQDDAARFGTPQELSDDAMVGRPAARADGTFAVPYIVGVPLEGSPSRLLVALRGPRDLAVRAGEIVATDAAQDAAVAFEPGVTGAAVALYVRADAKGAAVARRPVGSF